MGSSTQVVPTTSNTQQKVEIPQYLQDAGQTAVSKATDFSNTPFQPFTGQTVAGLSPNQQTASQVASNSANAGSAFIDQAKNVLQSGTGALGQATQVANDNVNAGMPSANAGAALASLAGTKAVASGNAGAQLVDLAGYKAQQGQTAGQSDLDAARGYNAESASPVSATDIADYFNPYVQQALDPVIGNLTRSAGQTDAALRSKAGMSGAFGGSRMGLQQSQNSADLLRQIATTSGQGYSDAYDKALAASQADRSRQGQAAGTSVSIGNSANSYANDATSRLIQSGQAESGLATDAVNRFTTAAGANTAAGKGQSDLSDASLQRLLALINPSISLSGENRALGASASGLANDAINRLQTTGQTEQDYNQNVDNSAYQQYLLQQQDTLTKLNALIAAAGGTPYGTSTTSNTQGTQVIQKPSALGQLAGLAGTLGGAAIMASDRDAKQDFKAVDDEDVLARFRGLGVEEYRYKPEVREVIGDDGRVRVGPMAQDWAKHFGGDGKTIPMPEIIGGLVSAVRALDRRTAKESTGAELRRLAA